MVSHADKSGTVTSRLWMVSPGVAARVAAHLGMPHAEQIQSPEQVQRGAEAGAGSMLYHDEEQR